LWNFAPVSPKAPQHLPNHQTVLSLFRSNQTGTALFLLLYVALTHASALVGHVQPFQREMAPGGMLYQALFRWADAQPFWSALGAAVLVFIQAVLINNLTDEFRLLNDRSWLAGVSYALVSAGLPEFLFLSPPLVAVTFLPWALRQIFKAYNQSKATGLIFDAAFGVTIGSLFYPPAFFLLIAGFAGMSIIRSFKLKEQAVFASGVVVPFFLAWFVHFWFDRGSAFWHGQLSGYSGFYHFAPVWDWLTIIKAGILVFFFVIIALSYNASLTRKLIHTQKCIGVLYWFLVVGALSIFLQGDLRNTHFLLLMPTMGILLAVRLSSIRNKLIAELLHGFLLGSALFIQFFPIANL
jgi:hypothetical protein